MLKRKLIFYRLPLDRGIYLQLKQLGVHKTRVEYSPLHNFLNNFLLFAELTLLLFSLRLRHSQQTRFRFSPAAAFVAATVAPTGALITAAGILTRQERKKEKKEGKK